MPTTSTEIFFDPQGHTSRGVEFATVLKGLRRAQLDADRLLGLHSQLIMCFLRDFQAEYAMATLLESLPYKDWIIGVGLDSDERGNPPEKFAAVFARARADGYLLTVQRELNLTREQMITLQRNAVEASWAPPAVRQRLLDKLAALS